MDAVQGGRTGERGKMRREQVLFALPLWTFNMKHNNNKNNNNTQGFVKSMLDVGDNLERAAGAVKLEEVEAADAERLRALLKGLLEGVHATERILMQALKSHGVVRFDPTGEKFDPNMHSALFEVDDPSKDPGTVAAVTKVRAANGRGRQQRRHEGK